MSHPLQSSAVVSWVGWVLEVYNSPVMHSRIHFQQTFEAAPVLVYLAGFYPSLLRVEHSKELYAKTLGGTVAKEGPPTKLRFYDRIKGGKDMSGASQSRACQCSIMPVYL